MVTQFELGHGPLQTESSHHWRRADRNPFLVGDEGSAPAAHFQEILEVPPTIPVGSSPGEHQADSHANFAQQPLEAGAEHASALSPWSHQ